MRRKLAAVFLGAVLTLSGAASCPSSGGSSVEVEDCDAEDYRNRESDCGFTDSDRQKLKSPAAVKTPAKAPTPVRPYPVKTK